MIRFQIQVSIDGDDEALHYHGVTLTEERLRWLVAQAVYENTGTYDNEIVVSVMRLGDRDSDHA